MNTSKKTLRITVRKDMRLGDLRCDSGVELLLEPGKYLVDVYRVDLGGMWGWRTVKVEGHVAGAGAFYMDGENPTWQSVGAVPVDSGEVGLGFMSSELDVIDEDFSDEPAYVFRTASGLGDGCYEVEVALTAKGERAGFRVTFLTEAEVADFVASGEREANAEAKLRAENPLSVVGGEGQFEFLFRGMTFRVFGENHVTMPVRLEHKGVWETSPQGFSTIRQAYDWLVHMTYLSDHLESPAPTPATDEQIKAEEDARRARRKS